LIEQGWAPPSKARLLIALQDDILHLSLLGQDEGQPSPPEPGA
jgi:hypothetical protein